MVFRRVLSTYRVIIDRLWAVSPYIIYLLIAVPSAVPSYRKDWVKGGGGVMVVVKDTLPACEITMDDVAGEVCLG